MHAKFLLLRCEHISGLSTAMLDAARAGDWYEVDRLKKRAERAIDEFRALSGTVTLSAEQRRAKLACMQRILHNDGQIQALHQPWLRRLAKWLPTAGPIHLGYEGLVR